MKKNRIIFWIVLLVTIAIDVFIIINAFINGDKSAVESKTVAEKTAEVINTIKPETITKDNFDSFSFSFRKLVGHFGIFVFSGLFGSWTFLLGFNHIKNKKYFFVISSSILHGLLLAFLSEFVQIFVNGRSGNIKDVGIDFSGYILGLLLLIFIAFLIHKFQKKKIRT